VRGLAYQTETSEQCKATVEAMATSFARGDCVEAKIVKVHFTDGSEPISGNGIVVVLTPIEEVELMKPSFYQRVQWKKELVVCMKEAKVEGDREGLEGREIELSG
jgi:hypothetical protein